MHYKDQKIKNILHVAYTDISGGAARAAYRVHKSLCDYGTQFDFSSSMRVIKKRSSDINIKGGPANGDKVSFYLQYALNKGSRFLYSSNNKNYFSTAWPATGLGRELNYLFKQKKLDLVNLHWLGDYTLSIKEIGKLQMPLVWRLADQWAFCGCEHYSDIESRIEKGNNYMQGYNYYSKEERRYLIDLNTFMWRRKRKYWKNHINIVAPTKWIADCARKSLIFNQSNITVIPTSIDLEKWSPVDKKFARSVLNLPLDKKLILFGALGGTKDIRKGGDLLIKAIMRLKDFSSDKFIESLELVIVGDEKDQDQYDLGVKLNYAGVINNDLILKLYYSACDVFVLPSRQDNLPGTGIESHACGTPVVGFEIGGLPEIIDNHVTGALAKPFQENSLALAIKWVLDKEDSSLCVNARNRASSLWNPKRISKMYCDLYSSILNI